MNQDVNDFVENDKEIEEIEKELGDAAKNTASNTLKNGINKIRSSVKKAWNAIPSKIRIWIIIGIVAIALLLVAVSWIYKLFGDNSVAGVAAQSFIEGNVKIVKSDNNQGYYFEIDKEITDKYLEALNKAFADGWYDVDLGSLLDKDEDDEDNEESEEESTHNEYDEDDPEFKDDNIYDWFKTEDKSQLQAYLIKMIKAHIASSYPKLGYYKGKESSDETNKRLDNKVDEDGDYVSQGTIKVRRTKMNTSNSSVQIGEVTGDDIYSLDTHNDHGWTYYTVVPKNVKSKQNLPLVVFLHGGGEEDRNYKSIKNLSITKYVTTGKAYNSGEFVYLVPSITSWSVDGIKILIDNVANDYGIDKDRISLVGFSSGGWVAWQFINAYPDYLASDVVISTITNFGDVDNYLKTPIWLFAGTEYNGYIDEHARNNSMVSAYNTLKDNGNNYVKMTSLEGLNHGQTLSVFTDTGYQGIDGTTLFDWMLSHKIESTSDEALSDNSNTGEAILTYLPYDVESSKDGKLQVEIEDGDVTFKSLVDANDPEALNYFSLDLEKGLLLFATYTETIVTEDGETISSKYEINSQSVDISSVTSVCSMPFNFLFSLLQTSENPEWVMTVIDLALQESDVVLMIEDMVNESRTIDTTRQVLKTTVQTMDPPNPNFDSLTDGLKSTTYEFPYGETKERITTVYTNTATVYIQKAKTWCRDFEQEANIQTGTTNGETISNYTGEDYEAAVDEEPFYTDIVKKDKSEDTVINDAEKLTTPDLSKPNDIKKILKKKIKYENAINNNNEEDDDNDTYFVITRKYIGELNYSISKIYNYQKCTIKTINNTINYERFLGTLKNDKGKYYKGSLFTPKGKEISYKLPPDFEDESYPAQEIASANQNDIDILLELLLRHEDTQIHEQLMEYYWNIYMNEDIYDVDINDLLNLFSTNIHKGNNIHPIKTIYEIIRSQLIYWEGSGRKRGDNYVVYADPVFGEDVPVVGPRLTGALIGMSDMKIGDLIPIETVDEALDNAIKERYAYIKERFDYLKLDGYQYAAITIAHFSASETILEEIENTFAIRNKDGTLNEGKSKKAFYEKFERKYQQEIPHKMPSTSGRWNQSLMLKELRDAVNCEVYTNGWSTIYSEGGYSSNKLIVRRYGEWLLFQYGYDVVSQEYYAGDIGVLNEDSAYADGDGQQRVSVCGHILLPNGKIATIYNQGDMPYWRGDYTGIGLCNHVASAVVASIGINPNISMEERIEFEKELVFSRQTDASWMGGNDWWKQYGFQRSESYRGGRADEDFKSSLREHLKSGGYATLWLCGRNTSGASTVVIGQSGQMWTNEIHWIAILAYDEEYDQICIGDGYKSGWYDINEFESVPYTALFYIYEL